MSEYIQRVYKEDFDKLRIETQINNTLDNAMAITENLNVSIDKAFDILKLDNDLRQKILLRLAEREIEAH